MIILVEQRVEPVRNVQDALAALIGSGVVSTFQDPDDPENTHPDPFRIPVTTPGQSRSYAMTARRDTRRRDFMRRDSRFLQLRVPRTIQEIASQLLSRSLPQKRTM